MTPNPPVGVVLHAIGGLASAIFYLPYRRVRHWAWESYWLIGGIFSWLVVLVSSTVVIGYGNYLAKASVAASETDPSASQAPSGNPAQ